MTIVGQSRRVLLIAFAPPDSKYLKRHNVLTTSFGPLFRLNMNS